MLLKKSLFFTLLTTLFIIHSPCISTDAANENIKKAEETIENLQQELITTKMLAITGCTLGALSLCIAGYLLYNHLTTDTQQLLKTMLRSLASANITMKKAFTLAEKNKTALDTIISDLKKAK